MHLIVTVRTNVTSISNLDLLDNVANSVGNDIQFL